MADGPFVLCDTLCFIVNKYGKVTEKVLKSAMSDFYTVDCLSEAKLRLLSDIDKLDYPLYRLDRHTFHCDGTVMVG